MPRKELVGTVEPTAHDPRTFRVFNARTLKHRFLTADNEEEVARAEFGPECTVEVSSFCSTTFLVRR